LAGGGRKSPRSHLGHHQLERERERERNRRWSERVLRVKGYIANPDTLDMSDGPRLEEFIQVVDRLDISDKQITSKLGEFFSKIKCLVGRPHMVRCVGNERHDNMPEVILVI
jgi:hypothetical protein